MSGGHEQLSHRLEEAVVSNSHEDIIAIATEGGNVNASTQSGDSFIHLAARLGNCSSIAALGFLKADLEVLNSDNATPLEEAVKNNSVHSLKALLLAGARIDKLLLRGDTYLHIAAAGGQNGVLEVLLEKGMDVNKKNHLHETPLLQAVRAGNVSGVRILLENGADITILPEGGQKYTTTMAYLQQPLERITLLCRNSVVSKILAGAGYGARAHIYQGSTVADLELNSSQCLLLAFLQSLVTEDITSCCLLADVCHQLQQLQSEYLRLDNEGNSPCLVAALNNKPAVLQVLVDNGADLALRDSSGKGILYHAARCGHVEAVKWLLDAGVAVDMRCWNQRTALHRAALEGHTAVATLLLDRGADPAAKDSIGWTPLMAASRCGHLAVVQLLFDHGADINARKNDGRTALWWANNNSHTAVASWLRARGGVM
ncbi:putative ankyrin repeat protein RF_0381 [Halyomorpha halys]|uniref:putative ankyrin repeat protein RF_0381 n=1 Tax=Halyomorpha halys TaxID=286706 RepID=UPI0034D2E75C